MAFPRSEATNPVVRVRVRDEVRPGLLDAGGRGRRLAARSLSRKERIRENALLCCSEFLEHSFADFAPTSSAEWNALLDWLDVSGLALYFLDRIMITGQQDCLAPVALERLVTSQQQNRQRTVGMLEESAALQLHLQKRDLSYAVLKGLSLEPKAVPRMELRHQFDLDFLVASEDVEEAAVVLKQHGYKLFARGGKTLEFKKGQTSRVTARDLYRDLPYRGVELHVDQPLPGAPARLAAIEFREIHGLLMPVLSPVDVLLGQAFHVLKDLGSPFVRASHLLEFHRHVHARRDDVVFWGQLRQRTRGDQRARLAIGVAILCSEELWGRVAPEALTAWSVDRLPGGVLQWLTRYGRSSALQSPPGTKRYVLLQRELEVAGGVVRGQHLPSMPSRLPPLVIQSEGGESLQMRVARYWVQARFLLERSRFHLVEGLRLAVEAQRWRKQ